MFLVNCPQCQKKLPPPFRSSNRQVCTSCGWSDKPSNKNTSTTDSFNSEKKKSVKRVLPIPIGRRRIVIGTCVITPLLLLAFCNNQVLEEKCSDTNWEIEYISSGSLEIINLSQDKNNIKLFECNRSSMSVHRCINGSSAVELQPYIPEILKEVYECIEFKDQNENQYCLGYLESFSKDTYINEACTMKSTEITTTFGLSKSKNVPDPLIFNHTQTIDYEGSEYQQIEF